MDRVLVVAATRAEAAHVPEHLPVVVTGLGKTAAAVATTEALVGVEREGLTVVNIGSAGALREHLVDMEGYAVAFACARSASTRRTAGSVTNMSPEASTISEGPISKTSSGS